MISKCFCNCMFIVLFTNCCFFFFQEGPHSTIPEDEFYDAVETGLDRIEEEREARLARSPLSSLPPSRQTSTGPPLTPIPRTDPGLLSHSLWPEVNFLQIRFFIVLFEYL